MYLTLMQIKETAAEANKTSWINFKQVIWHKSFLKLLESIEKISKMGCWVRCGDGEARKLFPLILILTADYEEQ